MADAGETPWGALLLEQAEGRRNTAGAEMMRAWRLAGERKAFKRIRPPPVCPLEEPARAFRGAARPGGWDRASERVAIPFPRLGAVRGCGDPAAQERIKTIREVCKKRMGKLAELLSSPADCWKICARTSGGAGTVCVGGGLLTCLYGAEKGTRPVGLFRSGALRGPASGGKRRAAYGAGGPVGRAVRRGHGGRVSGHQ